LDAFVAATGYHRTYARWLLNHAQEVQQTLRRPRPPQYGPEVQHALFLVWNAANRICTKRLMPFLPRLYREQERRKRVLGWRRTHKDPFEGEWEQIFSWLQANPERSSGDLFREVQRRSPGRYQSLQIRTLQRGMRKIRAYPARKPLKTDGKRK
jgi:hypothetical protein